MSGPAVLVRPAGPDDVADLARLRWSWSEEGHAPVVGSREEYVAGLGSWMADHPDIAPVVAEAGGAVVGMGWVALVARVPDPRAFDRMTGDLQSVYVLPQHRGRGLGAAIVAALVEVAREAGCTRVTVHSDARAVTLYERDGFALDPVLLLKPLT